MRYTYFITAVTRHRAAILNRPEVVSIILEQLKFYRKKYEFKLCAFVLMPDHIHFIIIANEKLVGAILRDMKSMISRRVIDTWKATSEGQNLLQQFQLPEAEKRQHRWAIWQAGNWTTLLEVESSIETRVEYIHANPVRAGLVAQARDWPFSSARWYADRCCVGIEIELDWLQ